MRYNSKTFRTFADIIIKRREYGKRRHRTDQAIEKALKAYYVATHEDDPRFTHSHSKLLEDCGLIDQLTETEPKVYMYGSYAKGYATPDSDIDI